MGGWYAEVDLYSSSWGSAAAAYTFHFSEDLCP